jgi:hypothetical protein
LIDDVVVHIPRTCHHAGGKAVHELVALGLPFLSGKEFRDCPSPRGGIRHGSYRISYLIG